MTIPSPRLLNYSTPAAPAPWSIALAQPAAPAPLPQVPAAPAVDPLPAVPPTPAGPDATAFALPGLADTLALSTRPPAAPTPVGAPPEPAPQPEATVPAAPEPTVPATPPADPAAEAAAAAAAKKQAEAAKKAAEAKKKAEAEAKKKAAEAKKKAEAEAKKKAAEAKKKAAAEAKKKAQQKHFAERGKWYVSQYRSKYNTNEDVPGLDNANCGPTSLTMVAKAFGKVKGGPGAMDAAIEKSRKLMGDGNNERSGTSVAGIARGAKAYGLDAKVRWDASAKTIQQELAQGRLVIVLATTIRDNGTYGGGHYFVVTKVADGKAYLNDPAYPSGPRVVSVDRLNASIRSRGVYGMISIGA